MNFYKIVMKGISALIATVLLLAFTIAVAGIVSIFFTSFTKQTTGSVSSQGTALIACSDSLPTVDLVKYSVSSPSTINVTYSNPGSINLIGISVYISLANSSTFQVNGSAFLGSWATLNAYSSNSFSWNPLYNNFTGSGVGGGAPTEVRVVGVCQTSSGQNQTVSGSCLSGGTCISTVA